MSAAPAAATRAAVLIDRDGVIVRNRPDYVKTVDEMDVLPGALEALAALSRTGHRVFVVTNQSAIGRGLTTTAEVDRMHELIAQGVGLRGGAIAAFLVCPHTPADGCECRKPAPGLLYQARDRYGVDLASAVMVGDSQTDIAAASTAGCISILVWSGETTSNPGAGPDHRVANLTEAVSLIASLASSPPPQSPDQAQSE